MGVEIARVSGSGIGDFMMYWLGVYGLVIVGGVLPFVLLYLVSLGIWLSYGAIKSSAQTLKHALNQKVRTIPLLSEEGCLRDQEKAAQHP